MPAAHALYGARSLAQWIRGGGRPQRASLGYATLLKWHAYWFERNWTTQVERLGAATLPEDPVFILGLWRSGTTLLHELLAAATGWVTPQTWQCFNPSTCFLTAPPAPRTVGRPMDQGLIRSHGPQEDEFALLLLGEPSAYRGFIDPRRLRECGTQLGSPDPDPLTRWQMFIRGIAAGAATRVLLKSPNHSFRLPLLRARFPRAQFIWIGRHTGEVLASNAKMWRTMIDRYGLWSCPPREIEGFLEAMVIACTRVLGECVQATPRERLLWVDFEALRADPRAVLREVLEYLGVPPPSESSAARLDAAIARVPVHAGTRAELPDAPHVRELEAMRVAARRQFGRAFARNGDLPL